MEKYLINNSVLESCKYHLSEEFLSWCKIDQQIERIQNKPDIFLSTHIQYILFPPKGSIGITETFLKDAKKMCLIALEIGLAKFQDAQFNTFLGEILARENKPFDALFFLRNAKQYFEKDKKTFSYNLQEVVTLQLKISYKISNTLEKLYTDNIEDYTDTEIEKYANIEIEIMDLENELKYYRDMNK